MAAESTRVLHSLSRRRLVLGLAAALGCSLSFARAETDAPRDMSVMMDRLPYVHERARSATPASKRSPAHPMATTHFVDTCADDGSPNSLRSLIELSPNVHSGDTIDLTQLPMMCSKITLSNTFADGAITVTQDTLYLHGPGADQLTIDANGYSSVFRHYGYGTLQIEDLTITNGYHKTAGPPQPLPYGGCIFSTSSAVLISSVVSHCEVVSTSNVNAAVGGGIYARNALRMYFSSILDSSATSSTAAFAGGAWVLGDFTGSYSTISGNSANGSDFGQGGGLEAYASVTVIGSTISGNSADYDGGIFVGGSSALGVAITNSSITDNVVSDYGAIVSLQPVALYNSTVAFNRSKTAFHEGAGLYLIGADATIKSSIVAANFNATGPADLGAQGGQIAATSKDNLIIASTVSVPSGTISDCPKLGPLANNGGPTLTHALNHASPAIDQGDNDAILDSDQRQVARVIGANADIGAVEWSPTDHDERIFLGGFDAKCEW